MAEPISRYWIGTVAQVPNPEATVVGTLRIITDAAWPGDTTVGGGTDITYCVYDGQNWTITQDSELELNITVTQAGHGFTAGQILSSPAGGPFQLADTSAITGRAQIPRARAMGMVRHVLNANEFVLQVGGITDKLPGTGTRGIMNYVNPDIPGAIQATEPIKIGQMIVPVAIYVDPQRAILQLGGHIHPVTEENEVVTGAAVNQMQLVLPGDRNTVIQVRIGILSTGAGRFGMRINGLSGYNYERVWNSVDPQSNNVRNQNEIATQWHLGDSVTVDHWVYADASMPSYETANAVSGWLFSRVPVGSAIRLPEMESAAIQHQGIGGVDSIEIVETSENAYIGVGSFLRVSVENPAVIAQ